MSSTGYIFEKSGKLKQLTDAELAEYDSDSSVIICSCGTSSDGRPYWLYLAVKPSKYKEYKRLSAQHTMIRFSDYGKILRRGYGEEVPAEVKQEMKEKYGCDDNYVEWLRRDIEKERTVFLKDQEEKENKRIGDIVAMMKQKQ